MAGHMVATFLYEMGAKVLGVSRFFPEHVPFPSVARDLESQDVLGDLIHPGEFDVIINCVGVLNSDALNHQSRATFLNSYLPHWLVERCRKSKTKIIHLSTDCVFSGQHGNYSEASFRDGDTFYDRSKALGEFQNDKDLVFRQSIIGPDLRPSGIGLLNWFLQCQHPVDGYTNAIWNGITTLELANGIFMAIEHGLTGLYHFVSPKHISKHDLLVLCGKIFCHPIPITPFSLKNAVDKTLVCTRMDFSTCPASYPEQINKLREWMILHKTFYPHYKIIS